jgi:molybdopterin/thiamine biosynthesis adenylyltransferase
MADGAEALRQTYLQAREQLAAAIGPDELAALDAAQGASGLPPPIVTLRSPPVGHVVRTDCTTTELSYPRDTRLEERWPEDSPEYLGGNERHNRYRPPMPEIDGDVFDRQRCIIGWDQGAIEEQVCFVLGTGGVGQDAALALARLGVGRIILLDCDTYDASNLTRQCLGSLADIGDTKVNVAARNLAAHNLRSVVETHHLDAMARWPEVVALAKQSTVIFNGIDIGPMWDFCVNSLCKELSIPYVASQSFDWRLEVEFFSGKPSCVCEWCGDADTQDKWTNNLSHHFGCSPSALPGLESRFLAFCADREATSRSGGVLNADAVVEFLETDPKLRMNGPTLRKLVAGLLDDTAGGESQELTRENPLGGICGVLRALMEECVSAMLPGSVTSLEDTLFIPKPAHLDTRFVGSWVGVCLTAGVLMVTQWASYLTGRGTNPPTNIVLMLDEGWTEGEETANQQIEMVKQGIVPVEMLDDMILPKMRANDPCKASCRVCAAMR